MKKGFTLIELLAVIVILAVITIIAVPIILDMIDNARRGAAVASAYGYIDAVEKYQVSKFLRKDEQLTEGNYNVNKNTTIDGKIYDKLNNILTFKGTKPTAGTVSITKNNTIGGALLCISNYIITYSNNETKITADDCEDMNLQIIYSIDTNEWARSKTLTIIYPEGNVEYYLKLESGSGKIGETSLVVGEEKKVNEKELEVVFTEESKISTWIVKNNKTIKTPTYEIKKIDNVEVIEPVGTATSGYPMLTINGVLSSVELNITSTQDGTTPYYSIDNGKTWIKYIGKTNVNATNVKAKMVRNESKIESEVKNIPIERGDITDALPGDAYDNDETTRYIGDPKYIGVDSSMIGKDIELITVNTKNNDDYIIVTPIKYVNGIETEMPGTKFQANVYNDFKYTIPDETEKLKISFSKLALKEIRVYDKPTYQEEKIYPILTKNGVEKSYNNVTINYFDKSVQKLYKIDDGEWISYQHKPIRLETYPSSQTIFMKGIDKNGKETSIVSYTATIPNNALPLDAYDNDETTRYIGDPKYISVDSSMIGKDIELITVNTKNNDDYIIVTPIKYVNGVETEMSGTKFQANVYNDFKYTIPDETKKLKLSFSKLALKEIRVYNKD